MIRLHRDCKNNYYHIFDHGTGIAVRWGKNGQDPFWREEGPELLDLSITDYCERECEFCYRKAGRQGSFMDLSLYEEILRQAEQAGVQQIALGGGNPNQHPDFTEFLKLAGKHHIKASYTTNGQGMTEAIYQATKRYGGAVAVSWYTPYRDAMKVIETCGKQGIPVNIHFVLRQETLSEALTLLESEQIPWNHVNAIIFLNYKPMGSRIYKGLRDDETLEHFLKRAISFEKCKVGFDSCMISWLMRHRELIAVESIDFCEAGRFSAFISEKGIMYPCSFLCGDRSGGENIREKTLVDIWRNGAAFREMRDRLAHPAHQRTPIPGCVGCQDYEWCHGGCQEFTINRCR